MGLKAALVTVHLVFLGVIFLFDSELIEKTKHEPWYVLISEIVVSFFLSIYFEIQFLCIALTRMLVSSFTSVYLNLEFYC